LLFALMMMDDATVRRWAAVLLAGAAVWVTPFVAAAGKLDKLRDRTQTAPDSVNSDGDAPYCTWLALLFGCVEPTVQVASLDADPALKHKRELLAGKHFFLPYPYALGAAGNAVALHLPSDSMLNDCTPDDDTCLEKQPESVCLDELCFTGPAPSSPAVPAVQHQLRTYRLQLFADVGQDTDGLKRGTLGASLDSNQWLGVDTRWTYWLEKLPGKPADSLWLGDINLRLELVTAPALQLALGLGARLLLDGGTRAGVNATAVAELYPLRPLVLRAEFDAGNLGKAVFWEAQANVGVLIQRWEIYAGVARLRVEDLRFDSAFGGLRVHL
jgi:hypothetical protein